MTPTDLMENGIISVERFFPYRVTSLGDKKMFSTVAYTINILQSSYDDRHE
jgi:hypothetical protein